MLYKIASDLESDILSGRLLPGAKILPIRILAIQYQVNPNTVQRAVKELINSGLLITWRGRGICVTENVGVICQMRENRVNVIVDSFMQQIKILGYSYKQIKKIVLSQILYG